MSKSVSNQYCVHIPPLSTLCIYDNNIPEKCICSRCSIYSSIPAVFILFADFDPLYIGIESGKTVKSSHGVIIEVHSLDRVPWNLRNDSVVIFVTVQGMPCELGSNINIPAYVKEACSCFTHTALCRVVQHISPSVSNAANFVSIMEIVHQENTYSLQLS